MAGGWENFPPEVSWQVAIKLKLKELLKFCQTGRNQADFCRDRSFMRAWIKENKPKLINLYLKYEVIHPELSPLEMIENLIEHVKLGELATIDSYFYFGEIRLIRMAGRQGDLDLYRHFTSIIGSAPGLTLQMITGLLEGSEIIGKQDNREQLADLVLVEYIQRGHEMDLPFGMISKVKILKYVLGFTRTGSDGPHNGYSFDVPIIDITDIINDNGLLIFLIEKTALFRGGIYSPENFPVLDPLNFILIKAEIFQNLLAYHPEYAIHYYYANPDVMAYLNDVKYEDYLNFLKSPNFIFRNKFIDTAEQRFFQSEIIENTSNISLLVSATIVGDSKLMKVMLNSGLINKTQIRLALEGNDNDNPIYSDFSSIYTLTVNYPKIRIVNQLKEYLINHAYNMAQLRINILPNYLIILYLFKTFPEMNSIINEIETDVAATLNVGVLNQIDNLLRGAGLRV